MSALFLAFSFPDDRPESDPDDVANELCAAINKVLYPGARTLDAVMVSLIPSPQWLTPETLANLRAAAAPSTPGAPEAPQPTQVACRSCGTSFDDCTARINRGNRACCSTCGYTDTHNDKRPPPPAVQGAPGGERCPRPENPSGSILNCAYCDEVCQFAAAGAPGGES